MRTRPNLKLTNQSEGGVRPGLVPFQAFFAVLGYAAFCTLFVLVALEVGSWIAWTGYHYYHSPLRHAGPNAQSLMNRRRGLKHIWSGEIDPPSDMASASPAYDPYPWAEEFWEEERSNARDVVYPYEPFRLWGGPRLHGQFTNIEETEFGRLRRTVNQSQPGCNHSVARKVWFFGGSTAWGQNTPDFATIPSYLSAKLNTQPRDCFEVFNMGVPAYVSNQEVIYLMQLLKAGHRPEVVIFYDGINDTTVGAYSPALPATHFDYPEVKAKSESKILNWPGLARRSYLLRIVNRLRMRSQNRAQKGLTETQWHARALATLDNYESNMRLAQVMAKEYGFDARFFWQPILLYGNKPRTPFERIIGENQGFEKAVQIVFSEAEKRLASPAKLVSLAHIFDSTTETIYTDCVHLGPRGNEMVATAIAVAVQSPPGERPPVPAHSP
ncbi:MAG: SGNH/GDSL hydrolase family protein [Terriglobia bacterium]